ncbi:MAG: hypothetical protein LBL46_01025 [Rickettsiales bacterium]|jgi:hypothetical protein|nr:hypothetical protein [Rickettsiales bacterium]
MTDYEFNKTVLDPFRDAAKAMALFGVSAGFASLSGLEILKDAQIGLLAATAGTGLASVIYTIVALKQKRK